MKSGNKMNRFGTNSKIFIQFFSTAQREHWLLLIEEDSISELLKIVNKNFTVGPKTGFYKEVGKVVRFSHSSTK